MSIDEQSPEHRPGRRPLRGDPHGQERRGPPQRPGRRRPGDDVRLRLRRDRRPHAAADLAGPPHGRAPGRGAPGRRGAVPAARRQDPGDLRLRGRHAGAPAHRADLHAARPRGRSRRPDPPRPHRARHPPGRAGAVRRRRLRPCSSTRRARSSSAAPTPTPASPAARSSSTPTAAWPATAAARSAARTRRRSTARPPTPPAGWPSTSSARARPAAARCRWPTPSAWPSPVSILVETFGTSTVDDELTIEEAVRDVFDLRPGGHHQRARPAAADLPQDGGLRPLRPAADPEFTWEQLSKLDDFTRRRRPLTLERAAAGSRVRPADVSGLAQDVRLPRPGRAPRTRCGSARSCGSRSTAGESAGWVVGAGRRGPGGRRR